MNRPAYVRADHVLLEVRDLQAFMSRLPRKVPPNIYDGLETACNSITQASAFLRRLGINETDVAEPFEEVER